MDYGKDYGYKLRLPELRGENPNCEKNKNEK